ncbi:hypothetical protein HMPREF9141_2171 [Prevotella multiformis DSM 16608]|uniref:Uncharacterized protein n=1 Tax=Prevotella multiformis DSM 16608 TaxID=888743 RepID=F0F9A4_9BACT|nr:hypothetical protein HMPREF9141_2171 [Prevotella multiformis DSM 16608]
MSLTLQQNQPFKVIQKGKGFRRLQLYALQGRANDFILQKPDSTCGSIVCKTGYKEADKTGFKENGRDNRKPAPASQRTVHHG